MSHLSAALDRAAAEPAASSAVQTAAVPPAASSLVPSAWISEDEPLPTPRAAITADDENRLDADFAFQFSTASAGKLVVGTVDHVVIEQHRRLAALIHRAQVERGVTRVMVASAVAAEGKTLTATNIALTLSH